MPKDDITETDVIGGGATTSTPTAIKLVVLDGPDAGMELALDRVARIGTDPGCHLVLTDQAVSREHAAISSLMGQIALKDLDSRNGTHVGEARISDAIITMGSLFRVGHTTIALQPRFHVREVQPSTETEFGELYGSSVAMREVFAVLERVAPSDITVLIEGESGTGKELAARAIHEASPRAAGPYVVFDCASVPRELAESELFGHVRGAFSGALTDREGAFHRADGGTICLDEIGELPLDLQPKLLRVLETGDVKRVGEDGSRHVDVRVVAATNRDLNAEARRRTFRADLLYRLMVVKVRMPPLRSRPDDIAGLVRRMLHEKLRSTVVGGENLAKLLGYSWPGNVRELRNVLARAVALSGQPATFDELVFNVAVNNLEPIALGSSYPGVASPMPYKQAKQQLLASFDRAYVEALMHRQRGNVSKAAESAELSRRSLYDLIKRTTGSEPTEE